MAWAPALKGATARLWFRVVCRLSALRIRASGRPIRGEPAIFVANHVSYLDIPVLGAVINPTFVAKREVAGWPALGWLARTNGTIFVERARCRAHGQCRTLNERLGAGDSLLFFPEGTSSAGERVLPFKSALFAAAERRVGDVEIRVQPVTVAYIRYRDGRRLSGALRDRYAWYGDMTLVDHLYAVFGLEGADIEVMFHEPVRASCFPSRKELARHCHAEIARGLAAARRQNPGAAASGVHIPEPRDLRPEVALAAE